MGKPAPAPMECSARRYKAIPPSPGSRPRTKSFLLSNSITLPIQSSPTLDFVPKQMCCLQIRSLSEISFSELPSQGSRFWATGNDLIASMLNQHTLDEALLLRPL